MVFASSLAAFAAATAAREGAVTAFWMAFRKKVAAAAGDNNRAGAGGAAGAGKGRAGAGSSCGRARAATASTSASSSAVWHSSAQQYLCHVVDVRMFMRESGFAFVRVLVGRYVSKKGIIYQSPIIAASSGVIEIERMASRQVR
jgi:hypothetical protein